MLYEIEAPADGTVAKLLYPVEAVVGVGLPVAVLAEAGEDVAEIAARYADAAGHASGPTPYRDRAARGRACRRKHRLRGTPQTGCR